MTSSESFMISFDFGHELRHEQAQCMLWQQSLNISSADIPTPPVELGALPFSRGSSQEYRISQA